MTTTATQIIQAAYRELNVVGLNDTPTTAMSAEALPLLNTYVQGVYGFELGENLDDWQCPAPQRTAPVAANWPQAPYPISTDITILGFPSASDPSGFVTPYPPRNARIVWGGTTATTIYFPEAPDDGTRMGLVSSPDANPASVVTLDGNGKYIIAPNGSQADTYLPPLPVAPSSWLFRSDLGAWVPVVQMTGTSNMPFPDETNDFWVVTLAMRLAPRYNKSVSAESQKAGIDALKRLKARYRQEGTTVYGSSDFPRSLQSYISGRWWF